MKNPVEKKGNSTFIPIGKTDPVSGQLENLLIQIRPNLHSIIGIYKAVIDKSRRSLCVELERYHGCFYKIRLLNREHKFILFFPSDPSRAEIRKGKFETEIAPFGSQPSPEVHTIFKVKEGYGWTEVEIKVLKSDISNKLTLKYPYLITNFMLLTVPLIESEYVQIELPHTTRKNRQSWGKIRETQESSYEAFEYEIKQLRSYLQGKFEFTITSEKLCDWITFCYILGLYEEGEDLFSYVVSGEVNSWYYERTKKLARLCTLRTNEHSKR